MIFDVHYGRIAMSGQEEKTSMKAKTTIDRFDYNIAFDPMTVGVGKDVRILVHLQFATR